MGTMVGSLELGCDCLGDIHYLDSAQVLPTGDAIAKKNGKCSSSLRAFAEASRCRCAAICIHEEDASIAWRHHDGRGGGNYVRRNRRLVVSSWFTVGNYDCETHHSSSFPSLPQLTTLSFAPDGVRYMMYPDGNLEVDISLSGIVRTIIAGVWVAFFQERQQ